MYMYVNGSIVLQLSTSENRHNNYIMARGATLLKLTANDVVTYGTIGAGNYGSTDGLVNAQGFLYSPLGGAAAAVAWGVTNLSSSPVRGPVSVVPFNVVNVNLQEVWNTTTNIVTIPAAGTYFIDLTTYLCAAQPHAVHAEATETTV
jgi:hypothetical protein